jgi:polysaccharide export outer membrane protein
MRAHCCVDPGEGARFRSGDCWLMLGLLRLRLLAIACLVMGASQAACSGAGTYVWFEQIRPETTHAISEYIIGVGDVLDIRVLGHEELTLKQAVRSDGRLAMLLIGDIEASGKRPSALKAELEGRLKDYIVSPTVSVNIDVSQPITVLIFGEVTHTGAVPLDQDRRLAHALALAGGLTDYASRTSIFVVRGGPQPMRVRFRYEDIYRNTGNASDFQLQGGDIVEVE